MLLAFRLAAAAAIFATLSAAQTPATLSIDEAVREALDRNLDLLAERYNLSVADARIITARLRPNPVLTVTAEHLDWLGTGFNLQNSAGPPEYSVRTDFILERGKKRDQRVAVASSARSVVEMQLVNTARTLALDVANAFVEVQLAKESVALAEENLKAFGDIVSVNKKRVKSGDLAEVELLRTELAELQFENAVRQAELRLRAARLRLTLLVGRGHADTPVDVKGELRRDQAAIVRDEVERSALERRPDLAAVQRDQARSLADLRLQMAQAKVDYTVGSEYRREQGVNGKGDTVGLFFSSNLPVFNRNQGEIERARQEQKQLEARIKALTASIVTEVDTAYLQYSNAKMTLDKMEQAMLAKAKDVRQITEFSYRKGEATLVELLDAQRAYNDTIQTYNEARAEFARSLYLMDAVSGKAFGQ